MATVGSFEIRMKTRRISSGRFPNISGNPFEKTSVSNYSVYYKGLLQKVQEARQDNGRAFTTEEFWEAWVLEEAPHPTVIVGITAVNMMTEREGKVLVEQLAPSRTETACLQ